MKINLKVVVLGSAFFALNLFAENLHFVCEPRNVHETPYRTFNITIFNADTDEAQSEVSYSMYPSCDVLTPDDAGLVDGFSREDTYATELNSHYRMIRIEGGRLGISWRRDVLQLQKRTGTHYKGLYEFPEGSEQLDLGWNSALGLLCERTL